MMIDLKSNILNISNYTTIDQFRNYQLNYLYKVIHSNIGTKPKMFKKNAQLNFFFNSFLKQYSNIFTRLRLVKIYILFSVSIFKI